MVVSDGFTGNVALKVRRGNRQDRDRRDPRRDQPGRSRASEGCSIRGRVGRLRESIDPESVGGAILLGLRKPVVVAHGSFGPDGIAGAVRLARRAADEQMVERTAEALESAGALRSAPAASVAPS